MIPKLATTPNGVYGLKLHAIEFDRVKGTRWAERLPSLSLIYLERRDVLGQAISFVRARQTEQWTSLRASKQEPTYDGPRINQTLLYLLQQQARWRYYFARNGGPRLHLIYELVAQSPQETVEAVGRMLGLTETPSIDPSQLRLSVQRDPLSDEWRQRFVAEFRDLGAFN